MIVKSEEVQEQTKRLRFKSISGVQHTTGDSIMDKSVKEAKAKGKKLQMFATSSYIYYNVGRHS